MPGVHNLRNAVAALGAVDGARRRPRAARPTALAAFGGVGRRFERLGEHGGVAVVDDYAHHPSELVATLAAARQAFPGRRLVAVFQPHLYSRTAAHGQAMGEALAAADLVIVTEVYAAREQPIAGVSGRQVADAARRAGRRRAVRADAAPTSAARVYDALAPGDVVLTLGAGDITRVGPELVRWLERGLKPRLEASLGGARLLGARALVRSAARCCAELDFFRVRRVEIAGLQYLDPAKVIDGAQALGRRPVCSTIPRRWRAGSTRCPASSRGRVRPAAAGHARGRGGREAVRWRSRSRGDGLALLDARGQGAAVRSARARRPICRWRPTATRVVAGVLARVRDSDPDLFARVSAAWRVRAGRGARGRMGGGSGSARRFPRRTFER